jgi:fructosamine-3-kinase
VSLPAAVRSEVEAAVGTRVRFAASVGGGCISPSFRVVPERGPALFVKTAPPGGPAGLLSSEAESLRVLGAAGAIRVPGIVHDGDGCLVLEWLEPGRPEAADWAGLGRDLARLHRTRGSYGWPADNFIGTLPQRNAPAASWPGFWSERRLRPQLEQAGRYFGAAALDRFEQLLARLPELLGAAEDDGPSLLHGDLWHGNVHMSDAGPAVIDPSSWYGHREVDLAMAALFGGFPAQFRDAYNDEWPLLPAAAARRPVYQLYYLLVHVNLFGSGYVDATERALRETLTSGRRS